MFSVAFKPDIQPEAIVSLVDALALFRIGYSWGGVTSLAMPYLALQRRFHPQAARSSGSTSAWNGLRT